MAAAVEGRLEGPGGTGPKRALLLCRRAPNMREGGAWELPGGKVEEGESPEAALLREIWEELGLEAELLGPARTYEASVKGQPFVFMVFPTSLPGQPAFLAAHDECRYFGVDELPLDALAPLDAPALADWSKGS